MKSTANLLIGSVILAISATAFPADKSHIKLAWVGDWIEVRQTKTYTYEWPKLGSISISEFDNDLLINSIEIFKDTSPQPFIDIRSLSARGWTTNSRCLENKLSKNGTQLLIESKDSCDQDKLQILCELTKGDHAFKDSIECVGFGGKQIFKRK